MKLISIVQLEAPTMRTFQWNLTHWQPLCRVFNHSFTSLGLLGRLVIALGPGGLAYRKSATCIHPELSPGE